MNQLEVLKKVEQNDISAYDAMKELYPEPKIKGGKRAFFIKMRVKIPEESKRLNTFLRILFAIPIPIIFARIGLRIAGRYAKIDELDFKEISRMLKYSRNTKIQVESEEAIVDIKIM